MKNLFMGAAAVLAMAVAGQASAQTVTGAVGIGNVNGNLQTSASTTFDASDTRSLDINIENTLSAASGSGFVGDLALGAGASAAQFSMDGLAGSLAGNAGGAAFSLSGNTVDMASAVQGNGELSGQVLNFGQSEYTQAFTVDYSADTSFDVSSAQFQSADVNFNGNAIFGTLGFQN